MKASLTIIFIFIASFLFAQNLVINSGFEDYSICPNNTCQISYANGWTNSSGSASYFNTCGSNGYSIPLNKFGYQQASSGNGYAEFNFSSDYVLTADNVGGQLTAPLIIGQKYFISFNISLAGKSSYASDRMGIAFSTVQNNLQCGYAPWNYTSVKLFSDSIISDSTNWVKISGSFISDSTYKYFSIGYFNYMDSVHYMELDTGSLPFALYYLDDVCVSTDSMACLTTDIHQDNSIKDLINIFPNPATNELTFDFAINDKYFFELEQKEKL